MHNSTLPSSTYQPKPSMWHWLLRNTGLEAWFQRAPTAAHAGQQECILLLLTLPDTTRATRPAHATLLAAAYRECAALVQASGGQCIDQPPGTLLLAWPAPAGQALPPVAELYFQLRASLRRLAHAPALGLGGAAGLGWVMPSPAREAGRYDKGSLRQVGGVLHESQALGGQLLLTAALHLRLAPAVAGQCQLHVAFEVPGHRYPATLYQVVGPSST